ncbi:MAG: response regulator [Candidatus Omnitrophica bacterium]|nr:response regulator [Candidatus Omnitrophota bacterium]
MDKKKILFIDDEEALCKLVKLNLEISGEYGVTTAYSGREGMQKIKETDFNLVIMDFKMPGMNGETLVDNITRVKPGLPLLIYSIYSDDFSTIDASIRKKVDGVIGKPDDREQLQKAVKDILDRKVKSDRIS